MFAQDDAFAAPGSGFELDARSASILGAGLPEAAERSLRDAGLAYHDDEAAEAHLLAAFAEAPDHPATLIGLYRFYFYKNRLAEALGVARKCLTKAARDLNIAPDWRDVRPEDAAFDSFDAVAARFFMFVLKGYAYLNMRTGAVEEGREAVRKLLALDPSDKVNAGLLLVVADRMGIDDDD